MSACPLQAMFGQGRAGVCSPACARWLSFEFLNPPPRMEFVIGRYFFRRCLCGTGALASGFGFLLFCF